MEILRLCLYVILFLLQYQVVFSTYNYDTIKSPLCREEQRQLLLQLKQHLSHTESIFRPPENSFTPPDNYYKTKFWNKSSDCCVWDGVTCDQSGHVIGLDLSSSGFTYLTGKIHSNSSLFRLAYLQRLNLYQNDFKGSEISSNFGQLTSLTYLNLAFSNFSGRIPVEFYHLSNLVSLDLSGNHFEGSEISSNFGQLTSLTYLNLAFSNFSGRIPVEFYHLSNLVSLDLSGNLDLNCDIKTLFGNMTKIKMLWLEDVNISSEVPTNMSSFLTYLDLSSTGLHGKLPVTIFEKPNLQVLILSHNDGVRGSFPKSLNRSNAHSIKILDLSFTSISGRLPESIGFMNNLNYMRLAGCKLWGPIPESIGNISEISEVDLLANEFNGHVPSTFSNLRQLASLDLSNNHLKGQLPDAFSNLQKLTSLILSNNSFTGPIPTFLTNMSQLERLEMSSNALTGPFPSRAGDGLQKLRRMDLSNNSIRGTMPSWLLGLPSLTSLDLSFNQLTGQIRKFNYRRIWYLDLSNNQLNIELESFYNLTDIGILRISHNTVTEHANKIVNASLPIFYHVELSFCDIKEFPKLLRNSTQLVSLDLSNNKIQGPIPSWFSSIQMLRFLKLSTNHLTYAGYEPWQQFENLGFLDLHSNSFHGTFPLSTCNMSRLQILNLSDNKLRGKIPECIGNSSGQLLVLDLRRNQFNGKIPTTIGSPFSQSLAYLVLNGNQLEGPLPQSLANCSDLEILDLGNNKIQDTFPSWLQSLVELKILILRSNRFHGSISPPLSNDSFGKLKIIDLSHNNFTGLLPEKVFRRLQGMKSQDQPAMKSQDQPPTYQFPSPPPQDGVVRPNEDHYTMTLSVKGADQEFTRVLNIFITIDLSNNNFHGHIPESLAYLYSLQLLNLSRNSISGSIPPALGYLTNLEHLDLSSNQLTGSIPQTLINLTFLEVLNLSHNHLVGPIPDGHQFSTFSSDSFDGNSGLCGAPLMKKCGHDGISPSPVVFEEEDSSFMMGFTWQAVVMGYGCGIVLGFILGNVMISMGKPKWFARFYYVEAANCLNRRKKRDRMVQGKR